jgi:hypothetical protein
MIIYTTKLLPKGIAGMSIYPFILLRHRDDNPVRSAAIIQHERIHQRQQEEILILCLPFVASAAFTFSHWLWLVLAANPFYVVYALEYLWFRLRGYHHQAAYMSISFEREAYDNQQVVNYSLTRRHFAQLNYL